MSRALTLLRTSSFSAIPSYFNPDPLRYVNPHNFMPNRDTDHPEVCRLSNASLHCPSAEHVRRTRSSAESRIVEEVVEG